jgi:hypothetical protein
MKNLITSVGFQDDAGNLLGNGSLILNLPPGTIYKIIAGGGQVVGGALIINLDATAKLPGTVSVWASDELLGSPTYTATLCKLADGFGPLASVNWIIAGTSPIDLSLLQQH